MIHFYTEPPLVYEPTKQQQEEWRIWLNSVAKLENQKWTIIELNYIFCTDDYLHQLNVEYLQHDTLTDVITFDNSENQGEIEGDIFISIDRIKDNAQDFGVSINEELRRVMVHGLLHLLGYGDKTETEVKLMRSKENHYLQLVR